jgi:hypothetical protein
MSTRAMGGRSGGATVAAPLLESATPVLTHFSFASPALALATAHDLSVGDPAAAYGLALPPGATPMTAVQVPTLTDAARPLGGRAARDQPNGRRRADTAPGPAEAVEPTRLPHGPAGAQGGGLSPGGGGAASPLASMIVLALVAGPCLALSTHFRAHPESADGYRLERPG